MKLWSLFDFHRDGAKTMSPSSCLNVNLLTGIRTQALASVIVAVLNGMPEIVIIE